MLKLLKLSLLVAFVLVVSQAAALAGDAGSPDGGTALHTLSNAANPDTDIAGYAKQMYEAVHGSNWKALASLILVGLVWLVRKIAPKVSWFNTDRGGACLALGVGVAGAAMTALAAGKSILSSLVDGLIVGGLGAGGFSLVKKILSPSDKPAAPAEPPK